MIKVYNIWQGYVFSGKTAKSALIDHMHREGTAFCNLDLSHFDLSHADWGFKNFDHADLTGTNFRYCNLVGAHFNNCVMDHTDFTGAVIDLILFNQLKKWPNAIFQPVDGNQLLLDF